MRKVIIANAHSENDPSQIIHLEMMGGSPYFQYIWINDIIHTIYSDKKNKIVIKKTKAVLYDY